MSSRILGEPANLPEQFAAARVLLEEARAGLAQGADWSATDPRQQEVDVAVCAIRRVIGAALQDFPHGRAEILGVALAAALGDHVGQLLKGLPDHVVQRAITANSLNLITAIGADPTRSGADVTISSGPQEKLH